MGRQNLLIGLVLAASCGFALAARAEMTAVEPDLDGDGKGDPVHIVSWEGPPLVVADLSSTGKPVTLLRLSSTAPRPELQVGAPGVYKNACAKGIGAGCEVKEVTLKTEGLIAAFPEASAVLLYLEDGKPQELRLSD